MDKNEALTVQLNCIGDARIITHVACIDPSAEVVFGAALFLILHRNEVTTRKQLQELLWPSVKTDIAAHRMRQTILRLRRLGLHIRAEGKSKLFLAAAVVNTDVEDLSDKTTARLDLPLFGTYNPTFSPRFADWLDLQREKIGSTIVRILLKRIQESRAAGKWEELEENCRSLMIHSADNEEATLALAESFAMRGDKLQSVKILDKYLADVADAPADLRVPAATMRKRIVDRMPMRTGVSSEDTPMFGREGYLRELVGVMNGARNKLPGVCLVRGEPGIGKTRLIAEFLSFASLQGFAAHRVNCRATDSNRPLSVVLDLIPLLRGMRGSIGSSPDTLSFLDTLGRLHPDNQANRIRLSPSRVNSKLDVAFADIIDAVSDECPLVLVIEDCQWIDSLSASVIGRILARLTAQRTLFVFTSRSEGHAFLEHDTLKVHDLPLEALSCKTATELLETIVERRGGEITPSYLGWATAVAEGNPFFLHELAKHWLETRNEHSAPPSLTAILRQRLSRLSPRALQVLQACAILENHSTVDNVEAVLGYKAHELLSAITELVEAGMIAVAERGSTLHDGGQMASRHDLLSETALLRLSAPGLSYLHRRAAKALEVRIQHTGDASTLWSCAKHWHLAGDGAQAFRLANSCAQHLLEAELPGEAVDAYAKALDYCTTDLDRLMIIERQATASYQSSDWAKVITFGTQARRMRARLHPNTNEHDELELMIRRAEWQSSDWNNLLAASLGCLEANQASVEHRLEAGIMVLMILSSRGGSNQARSTYQTIMKLCATSEHVELKLQASMIYNTAWGELELGVAAATDLVTAQQKKKDVGELLRAHCNAGVTLRVAGKFDQAAQQFREAISLADRHRIHLSKSRAIPMLAHMCIELGDFEEAAQCLHSLLECANPNEDRNARFEIGTIEARLALASGERVDIRTLVEEDLVEMQSDQLPYRRTYWKALRVAAQLAHSGLAELEAIADLEAEHIRTRESVFQAFATFVLYVGLISVGKKAKGRRILNSYLRCHRREPWPPPDHLLNSLLLFVKI
jgi:tetratricopeptide (TPR) repeat protein